MEMPEILKNVTVVDYFVLPIDIGFNELALPIGYYFFGLVLE